LLLDLPAIDSHAMNASILSKNAVRLLLMLVMLVVVVAPIIGYVALAVVPR
jgi:hypothetical protein